MTTQDSVATQDETLFAMRLHDLRTHCFFVHGVDEEHAATRLLAVLIKHVGAYNDPDAICDDKRRLFTFMADSQHLIDNMLAAMRDISANRQHEFDIDAAAIKDALRPDVYIDGLFKHPDIRDETRENMRAFLRRLKFNDDQPSNRQPIEFHQNFYYSAEPFKNILKERPTSVQHDITYAELKHTPGIREIENDVYIAWEHALELRIAKPASQTRAVE